MNNLKIILVSMILFYCTKSFSQTTTTILYDGTSNLSTTKCNVFAPPVNVGGHLHTGVIGGATFSTANGLTLPTKYTFQTGKKERTDYKISYSFKSGYTYRIEITASGTASNNTAYPYLGTALFTSGGLPYTSTSCGAGDISGFPHLGSVMIEQVNNVPTVYSPPSANFTSPYNYDYLVLEATCQAAEDISDLLYIQKIKIIETPPISFTLSSSANTISCGSTTPIVFTVNNIYNTPNVTNHTWNLGASNGWLYNGNPAPPTISTGTTKTLTLTPICGATQKNLSVIVTAGGNNYNTNTSAVTITLPTLSISGNSTLCSGTSDYTLNNNNLPCNSTVAWTSSKTNIATVTPTGNPGTVTRVSNGDVKITATVTACGTILPPISKTIIVGVPQYTYEIVPSPISSYTECYKLNKTYSFTIQPLGTDPYYPNGPYQWYCTGIGVLGSTTKTVSLQFTQPGDYTLSVRPNSPCGLGPVSEYSETLHASSSCSGGGYYLVSPNPMKGNLKITTLEKNTIDNSSVRKKIGEAGFDRVEIIDKTGNVVFKKSFPKNTQSANMSILSLHSDIYVVRIFNENTSEVHKIMVQK